MRQLALIAAFLLVPGLAVAAPVETSVVLVGEDTLLPQRLSTASSKAAATVEGAGDQLVITSSADAEFDLYIFPVRSDRTVDTKNALYAKIPGGTEQEASVDLTLSPAWSMGDRTYKVYILSNSSVPVSVFTLEILRNRNVAGIALSQLLQPETYRPSSYHRLAGYRVLGFPFVIVFGMTILIIAAGAAFFRRSLFLPILLVGFLLYGARVSADLAGWAVTHAMEWRGEGTYEQAGSTYQLASVIQVPYARDSERPMSIVVCHDGSSYLPTLLQYLIYPIPVTLKRTEATTHAVVLQKVDWKYENGVLRCGAEQWKARSMERFPDGSILYELLP